MDMKQIEQVIAILQAGSFNRAAQALYISQPNLSYSIKSLESELGYPIFERISTGVRLTDPGRRFLDYAQPVYQQFQLLQTICSKAGQSGQPTLSVSTSPLKFVSNVFIALYQEYAETGAVLTYREDTLLHIFENVESSMADLGIILFPSFQRKTWMKLARLKRLEYHKLSAEKPHVILGCHNPLYVRKPLFVSLEEMLPFPYIGCYPGLFDGCDEHSALAQHLYTQKRRGELTVSNRAMLYSLLEKTPAYSITSNNQNAYGKQPAYENILAIPIRDPGFSFEIGWIIRTDAEFSSLDSAFISALCATITPDGPEGKSCSGKSDVT
ncbi:MAG: LysR family transcriptional regulator [Lachnospiraceae bacterium]|nr:LysR family transcriptional regulator [Lachnospiraceae bacterium]